MRAIKRTLIKWSLPSRGSRFSRQVSGSRARETSQQLVIHLFIHLLI